MKLFPAALAAAATLSFAARADPAAVASPELRRVDTGGLLLDLGGETSMAGAVEGSDGSSGTFALGARAAAGYRFGHFALGAEGEIAGGMIPFTARADVGTLAGFAGWSFPLGHPGAAVELRARAGQHRYFNVENGGALFSPDPSTTHAELPFVGGEVRAYFPWLGDDHSAVRVFGAMNMDSDLSTAQLAVPNNSSVMHVGGITLGATLGIELSLL